MRSRLIREWGVNDVGYPVHKNEVINGNKVILACPYYTKWRNMIMRCFDERYQNKYPDYKDCTICEEWKYLSNFIKWVDSQPNRDWENCDLDKDLLIKGNKIYSPDTVVFISKTINYFILNCRRARGDYLIGVRYIGDRNNKNLYDAQCRSPFKENKRFLGNFPTELEAHLAWQAKKHEYACILAEQQQDPRIAKALRERYAPDKDWTKA